jgi:hypothetical protein
MIFVIDSYTITLATLFFSVWKILLKCLHRISDCHQWTTGDIFWECVFPRNKSLICFNIFHTIRYSIDDIFSVWVSHVIMNMKSFYFLILLKNHNVWEKTAFTFYFTSMNYFVVSNDAISEELSYIWMNISSYNLREKLCQNVFAERN